MQIKIMLYISTSNQDEVIETRFIFLLEILKHNKKKITGQNTSSNDFSPDGHQILEE